MVAFFEDSPEHYTLDRPNFLECYKSQIERYLQRKYPNQDFSEKINTIISSRFRSPKVHVVSHPTYGNSKTSHVSLELFFKFLQDDILTPAGVVYKATKKQKSILVDMLEESVKDRNIFKKKQLEAAAIGDKVGEQHAKRRQASKKIFNNSVPGVMGSRWSFLSDFPGFNAITTIGQQSVKTGYTHTERLVAGNLYLTSFDDVVDYCQNHLKEMSLIDVQETMKRYNLHYPTEEDLFTYFFFPLSFRKENEIYRDILKGYIKTLIPDQRAYLYYVSCFKHLLIKNKEFVSKWLNEFFRRDVEILDLPPEDIFKVEDDLLSMAMSRNFSLINEEPDMRKAIKNNPDGVKHLLSICHHMEKLFIKTKPLWTTFFVSNPSLTKVWTSNDLVRRCVLTSDTDSVIFTTHEIVNELSPENRFSDKALDVNAFVVYLVSQTLENVFMNMTTGIGMDPDVKKKIKMKNEFYYSIFIRSPLKKHYAGKILIQEGKILPSPEVDLKGINYVGSGISQITHDSFQKTLNWVFEQMETNPTFSYKDFMLRVSSFEYQIYKSLINGETTYLSSVPIKQESGYKDPLRSNYYYYLLWQDVFENRFGEFQIPNKVTVLPVKNKGTYIFKEEFREKLKAFDEDMERKLFLFLEKYNKKILTRILLPPSVKDIPEILRELIDIRSIIFTNGRPFYLLSRSFGLSFADKDLKTIASDFMIEEKDKVDISVN